MVVIDKIVSVGLVIGPLDSSTQLRQNHHPDVFIFQKNRLVNLVRRLIADLLHRGVGIDFA